MKLFLKKELTNVMRNMNMSFSNGKVYAIFAVANINRKGEIGYNITTSCCIGKGFQPLMERNQIDLHNLGNISHHKGIK